MPQPSPRQISEALRDLAQTALDILAVDQNIPAEDQRLWQDMLEAESAGDPFGVLDRLVHEAAEAEAFAKGVAAYATKVAEREARLDRKADRLRGMAQQFMQRLSLTTVERPTYTATIAAGHTHVIPTREPEELPPRFQRVTIAANKTELRKALDAGERNVPAELSNPEPTLRIRMG